MKKGFGFSKLSLGLNLKWGSGSIFEVGKKFQEEGGEFSIFGI